MYNKIYSAKIKKLSTNGKIKIGWQTDLKRGKNDLNSTNN